MVGKVYIFHVPTYYLYQKYNLLILCKQQVNILDFFLVQKLDFLIVYLVSPFICDAIFKQVREDQKKGWLVGVCSYNTIQCQSNCMGRRRLAQYQYFPDDLKVSTQYKYLQTPLYHERNTGDDGKFLNSGLQVVVLGTWYLIGISSTTSSIVST